MGEGTTENSGDNNSAADDEIERQLRALMDEVTAGSRLREPSAAEREELAATAQKQSAKTAKKTQKQARKQQRNARSRRRGHQALWSWIAAIVILIGAGTFAYSKVGHALTGAITRATGSGSPDDTQPIGAAPPPADPFTGTPADKWADGAAGIVIPKAEPVGQFSAAQVQDAYQTTKELLIAANLDSQTLDGGTPATFASLLGTKEQRTQFLDGLSAKGLDKDQRPNSTRIMVVSFPPGSTKLIGDVIKVHGTMSAHAVAVSGGTALNIDVNYLFAYPIEPPGNPSDWMRFFSDNYGSFSFAQWDDPGGPLEAFDQTVVGTDGARCSTTDGYDYPDWPQGRVADPSQSGPAVNPYSPGAASPGQGGNPVCGNSTSD